MATPHKKLITNKGAWRLIESGFQDPYTNMASDEALLDFFSEGKIPPTLRFYGWKPGGFSLGCFQDAELLLNTEKCNRGAVPFVRRMTGGSIVYHGSDISYSIVCRREDLAVPRGLNESYKGLCGFLVSGFRNLGLDPQYSLSQPKRSIKSGGFCCQEEETYDITLNGRKLGGNAQRRRRDVVFQHGFLPLHNDFEKGFTFSKSGTSKIDTKVISLNEALGREVQYIEIKEVLVKAFKEAFKVELKEDFFTLEENMAIERLVSIKYSQDKWNIQGIDDARNHKKAFKSRSFSSEPAAMA